MDLLTSVSGQEIVDNTCLLKRYRAVDSQQENCNAMNLGIATLHYDEIEIARFTYNKIGMELCKKAEISTLFYL